MQPKFKTSEHSLWALKVADPDLQIRGGGEVGGHPDPEIRGGPVSKNWGGWAVIQILR